MIRAMTQDTSATSPSTRDGGIFGRVNAGRASEMIVDQLRQLIRDGRLTRGDRLPAERDLAEKFGVSRVTLREALRGLEANGIITTRVGATGGAIVTGPTSQLVGNAIVDMLTISHVSALEITEARQVFELGIVSLVCERATELDIAELLEICDRGDAALAQGSYPLSLSAEFHSRMARASHNAAIAMVADSFHGPTVMSLRRAHAGHPETRSRGNREHRQFVYAVRKGDAEKATAIMRMHIDRTARYLCEGQ